jgi:hypothetical protein
VPQTQTTNSLPAQTAPLDISNKTVGCILDTVIGEDAVQIADIVPDAAREIDNDNQVFGNLNESVHEVFRKVRQISLHLPKDSEKAQPSRMICIFARHNTCGQLNAFRNEIKIPPVG